MIENEQLTSLPFTELIQPHPKACTPTNTAYLIALVTGQQFSAVLEELLRAPTVSTKLYSENKGISFPEISDVVNNHLPNLKVEIDLVDWVQQPQVEPPFIIGVKQLPAVKIFKNNQTRLIDLAKEAGALVERDGVWEYPNGHAITVVDSSSNKVVYFDSYLGREVSISRDLFIQALRDKGQLLRLNDEI